MIAIPSRDITVTSTNIPEGNMSYAEWSDSGTYDLDGIIKITDITTSMSQYVGGIFVSLKDLNDTSPMDCACTWDRIEELDSGNETKYAEYTTGTYSLNDKVKITTWATTTEYIGKIYKSLVAGNTTNPLEDNDSWVQIDVLEYDNTRGYHNGDTVSILSTHSVYLSMEDQNGTSPLDLDSKWQFISKTNACNFADFYFTTMTEAYNQDLIMELTFNGSDHLSMFGVFGSRTIIEQLDVHDGDAVIATDTISRVDTTTITDFATYLQFIGCGDIDEFQVELIEKTDQKVRVTIEYIAYAGKNIVELATLTVGRRFDLGCTLYGLKSTRTAISPPKYDKWGEVDLGGDDYVKIYSGKMNFKTRDIDYIDGIIDKLFNQPTVYLLTNDVQQAFNTFGLMTVGEISADEETTSSLPLKIKSFKSKRNTKECY